MSKGHPIDSLFGKEERVSFFACGAERPGLSAVNAKTQRREDTKIDLKFSLAVLLCALASLRSAVDLSAPQFFADLRLKSSGRETRLTTAVETAWLAAGSNRSGKRGMTMTPKTANVLVAVVALVHVAIAVVEMLFWNQPFAHEGLHYNAEEALKVAPIVANAGLYNGFLAAGLIWGLRSSRDATSIKVFFLTCVIIAGIFGAVTLKWTTLVLQTLPGAVALLAVWKSRPSR
jgi:putative membrane protein